MKQDEIMAEAKAIGGELARLALRCRGRFLLVLIPEDGGVAIEATNMADDEIDDWYDNCTESQLYGVSVHSAKEPQS